MQAIPIFQIKRALLNRGYLNRGYLNRSALNRSLVVAALLSLSGCSELRGRYVAREGNHLYLAGEYAQAVQRYAAAEQLVPELAVVVLNKGLACRQLILPGSASPEAADAVRCALSAFERFRALKPSDPRGEQLYVQTLFDADRFSDLIALYTAESQAKPNDLGPINGLIQVYSRAGRFDETLKWSERRAEIAHADSEAQYGVGVLIWNRLFQKGGGPDKATFDPRPEAPKNQEPPVTVEGEITGAERVNLADVGLRYLERAVALRPNYREAAIYLNLLERQKSYAYFDQPEQWQACVTRAEIWRNKAAALAAAPSETGPGVANPAASGGAP